MSHVFAGLLSLERRGVRTSRWATADGNTVCISDRDEFKQRVDGFKDQGIEVVYTTPEVLKYIINSML